jgi:CBS domain containing-hemolysin-like protein
MTTLKACSAASNYLISAATVVIVQAMFTLSGNSAEILATLLITPFLFVYCEMFPKYIFMQSPERLLRFAMPMFFVFFILLLPITLVIWLLNRGLALLLSEQHKPLQTQLARQELVKRIDEGQEYGLILSSQRQLTRNVFNVASQSIMHYTTPIDHYPVMTRAMSPVEMLAVAQQHELSEFPVFSDRNPEQPIGYIRTIELALSSLADATDSDSIEMPLRELIEIDDDHSPLNAMLLFQTGDETLALVIDENDNTLGLISEKRLMNVLFSGEASAVEKPA